MLNAKNTKVNGQREQYGLNLFCRRKKNQLIATTNILVKIINETLKLQIPLSFNFHISH